MAPRDLDTGYVKDSGWGGHFDGEAFVELHDGVPVSSFTNLNVVTSTCGQGSELGFRFRVQSEGSELGFRVRVQS